MDSKGNVRNKNWVFISVIVGLLILLIVSFIFNMMKCDDLRGRITLGELYDDFKGNDDPNSRMTAAVDISTKEGACSFDVFYEYDGYREVNSNYITPPLSDEHKLEIQGDIGDLSDKYLSSSLKDDKLDKFIMEVEAKYNVEEKALASLINEIQINKIEGQIKYTTENKDKILNETKEFIIDKIQNDKDICKRYQYPSGEKKFYNRLLDEEYIARH